MYYSASSSSQTKECMDVKTLRETRELGVYNWLEANKNIYVMKSCYKKSVVVF